VTAWSPDAHEDLKFHNDTERFLALQPIDTDDGFVALTQWPIGSDSWGRMVLTAERVLKVELTAGPPPKTSDGFLPRHAAVEIRRWTDFSVQEPTASVPADQLDEPTLEVLEWARHTTTRRLESSFSGRGNSDGLDIDPKELTGGEIAFLYDALVRLGDMRPTESLAEKTRLSLAGARNRVYRARKEGLLSATRRGEPGGWMTPQGWAEAQAGPHFPQLSRFVDGLLGRE
jgi:hypothetical protein